MNLDGTSIYKRKDSPFYWIKFWCPKRLRNVGKSSGQRIDDSQGLKRAISMARELSVDARAARAIAPTARWECWVQSWLDMKHQASPLSRRSETLRWEWLQTFLLERQIHGPQVVTYQLGLDYMKWRTSQTKRVSKKHPSHNTALWELRFLSQIMREAVRRGFIPANPLERMGIKKVRAKEKPEMTDAEVATIRAALTEREAHLPLHLRWMTISFEIASYQGCRMAETSVALSDIDEERRRITFHAKRAKVFTTQLHPALVPLIRQLRQAGITRTCILPPMVTKIWHWFFKGRPERNCPAVAPHLTFHCTRVTVITRMARAGVPIQQAMAYVGHADETVHRIYQRLQADDLTRCTAALAFSPSSENPENPGGAQTTPISVSA